MAQELFFIGSKLAGVILRVDVWLLVLACLVFLAVLRGWWRTGRWLSGVFVVVFAVLGFVPLGDVVYRPLEATYLTRGALPALDGIIILGGGEDPQATAAWQQPQVNAGGDRYLAAFKLAQEHPQARILFTGGSGRLVDIAGTSMTEAAVARDIFRDMGLMPDRLFVEDRSRTTAENARLGFLRAAPVPGETWALVTSAAHMPRALRSFEAAGWRGIMPYPVDYRSWPVKDGLGWNFERNLVLLNAGMREWVGHLVYGLMGR